MKLAADEIDFGTFKGLGDSPLVNPAGTNGIKIFTDFLSKVIGVLTIIAIIWFIFTFILGAIGIISSGGDKAALESAKKKITTGLVGLVVVVIAVFVIDLVGYFLGFSVSLLNLPGLFDLIPKQ
jgi:ABC-type transport system involved in multi-copper enzyme maturation permease subunit